MRGCVSVKQWMLDLRKKQKEEIKGNYLLALLGRKSQVHAYLKAS